MSLFPCWGLRHWSRQGGPWAAPSTLLSLGDDSPVRPSHLAPVWTQVNTAESQQNACVCSLQAVYQPARHLKSLTLTPEQDLKRMSRLPPKKSDRPVQLGQSQTLYLRRRMARQPTAEAGSLRAQGPHHRLGHLQPRMAHGVVLSCQPPSQLYGVLGMTLGLY